MEDYFCIIQYTVVADCLWFLTTETNVIWFSNYKRIIEYLPSTLVLMQLK